MKDELQQKLVEILTSMQNAVGKAGDFAMGQLPDVAQSYVLYGRAVETAGLVLLCLLAVGALLLARRFARLSEIGDQTFASALDAYDKSEAEKAKKVSYYIPSYGSRPSREDFQRYSGAILICAGAAGLFTVGALLQLSSTLLVWLSPKVWLIKALVSLVK